MNRKALRRIEIKDADKGEVVAVIATLNVIDADGDVTLPGAFEDGQKTVISSYGHTSHPELGGRLPVGTGSIREIKSEAVMNGRFFMDLPDAAATFAVVKALAEEGLGDWSYAYSEKASFGEFEGQRARFLERLKVHEVSPVLVGAGVNTRTLAAKSSGMKFGEHIDAVLADVEGLVSRATEVLALRAEKGKGISDVSAEQLSRVQAQLKRLEELVTAPPDPSPDEVAREYARFVALTQGACQ